MFTGIVQGVAEIVAIHEAEKFRTHVIALPEALCQGLELGASVAHNGVCLTVTRIEGERISFDLMRETLRITNLGKLREGDHVNIERAARFGDEIGGHAMSAMSWRWRSWWSWIKRPIIGGCGSRCLLS